MKGKDELVEVVLLGASPCVGCHGAGLKSLQDEVQAKPLRDKMVLSCSA